MQRKYNAWAIFSVVMTALFLVAGGIALFNEKTVIPEGYISPSELQRTLDNEITNAIEDKNSQISSLTNQISELTTQLAEKVVEVVEEPIVYVIDKLSLGTVVAKELSDREVKTLFDGKVEFDGDDYDAEEVVTLSKMSVLANENDFEGTDYLVIPKGSIEYKIVFDSDLNTSLIGEETLVFNFLGQEVEVSKWNGDEVTFSQGEEFMLTNGDTKTVEGKVFVLENVLEDSVYVSVDGVSKKIKENQTKTVNGLQVKVKDVIYSEIGPVLKASVVLGKEVTKTVVSGEEYAEDSIWEYVIDGSSIGIVLNDEFKELDDELRPLASGEKLCLPNDYVCVRYDGFFDEDFEEITFELDKIEELTYVEVRGNFQSELKDYTRLYINSTGIYDKKLVLINNETIKVASTDSVLNISSGKIVIEGFELEFNLSDSSVGNTKDYNVRTDWGTLVYNPKDSTEDKDWKISFPYEKLEFSVTIL